MKISTEGLNLIKRFEGCRLTAYKATPFEKYYTIGYGHYGADVKKNMKITQAQADSLLKQDLATAEKAVNNLAYDLNINQYSALVSFTFNCGAANLKKITNNNSRTLAQISARIPNYNTAGGVVLKGLVNRRAAEKALFDKPVANQPAAQPVAAPAITYFPRYTGTSGSIVTALKSLGISSTLAYRKTIAKVNNIPNFTGTATQNTQLLKLLKAGKLIKP